MKKFLFLALLFASATAPAKDIKTVVLTTQPQMHCAGCETRIKNNLRFVKGIKQIATDVSRQRVTVTYDADKASVQNFINSLKKIGYIAKEIK